MVRPPCCSEKVAVKKGPWTPEEDIILVSYIQEHGPGNWRTVPASTGLFRCSKSCRLRWTNYLRPGIRRGNFTEQEEKLIIHLQALLGNRWAAIASYLPQRTDNDIKNYWNTHLRKKLKKLEGQDGFTPTSQPSSDTKGQWERRLQTDIHMAKQALSDALSLDTKPNNIINSFNNNNNSFFDQNPNSPPMNMINVSTGPSTSYTAAATTTTTTTTTHPSSSQSSAGLYASSTQNIAKLLQGWMKDSPKSSGSETSVSQVSFNNNNHQVGMGSSPSEGFDSIFGFNSPNSGQGSPEITNLGNQGPLSLIEKWLLEDGTGQGHGDLVDMSLVGAGHGLF